MKKQKKMFLQMSLAFVACFILGCNIKRDSSEPTGIPVSTITPEGMVTSIPDEKPDMIRDLNGMQIVIGDSHSPETTPAPTNAQESVICQFRDKAMQTYRFTIKPQKIADWKDFEKVYITSVEAGKPVAQVYEMDYRFLAKPLAMGLFYNLATLEEFDFSNNYRWNGAVKDVMTKGDGIYGMRASELEPGGGILWNKRLFSEAGLDPELPYELQASGEWTWSKFEEICAILTRDTDGDGQTDVYATCSDSADTLQCLISSTGKDIIAVDETGRIYNNCKDRDVLDALEFAAKLYKKGYEMPCKETGQHIMAFREGKAAMQFGEEALCKWDAPYGENSMADEVGFVLPPKLDGQEKYHSYVYGNVWVIPSCYDAKTAADIAFAYDIYSQQVPGYESIMPDDYLGLYYGDFYRNEHLDERAVDETIRWYLDSETVKFLTRYLVDGLDIRDLTKYYPFEEHAPEECVEELWDSWQKLIDACNEGVFE